MPKRTVSGGASAAAEPESPLREPDYRKPATRQLLADYWRTNVRIMIVLLLIWAAVGLGCGVLFADRLNAWRLPGTGYPLGFWFAQQGSIVVFVLLILVYCVLLNRLDARHHRRLAELEKRGEA